MDELRTRYTNKIKSLEREKEAAQLKGYPFLTGKMNQLTFIDLFAGIGGFRRGMELAGHKCLGFCEYDKHAVLSYKAMHLLTEAERVELEKIDNYKQGAKYINSIDFTEREWYANDIRTVRASDIPRADIWTAGFPCQDVSIAGNQLGFRGKRSSLFFTVTGLIRDLEEEDRPTYLIFENVKNLFSVNGGFDFAKILIELDEIGYDAEWALINSSDVVAQNRERIFIVAHLRGRSARKVFPIQSSCREVNDLQGQQANTITAKYGGGGSIGAYVIESKQQEQSIKQIGQIYGTDKESNPKAGRIYDIGGISPILGANSGGNNMPMIKVVGNINSSQDGVVVSPDEISKTLTAGHNNQPKIIVKCININDENGKERSQHDRIYDISGHMTALNASMGGRHNIAIPVLTPDRKNKRQNGRRFKGDGDPMFTLTAQDRHGVAIYDLYNRRKRKDGICGTLTANGNTSATHCGSFGVFDGTRIRKLIPKECFRLQTWEDKYYNRAARVNSDNQLYRQAGNGVTVTVIQKIGERL